MKRAELWKLSIRSVCAAPVRSLLTVLGIAIGAGAILAVITLGDAGKTQVKTEMTRLGIDKVWLAAPEDGLQMGDGSLLEEVMGVRAAETMYLPAQLRCSAGTETLTAVGCNPSYLEMCGVRVVKGRNLHALEWLADSRSMLLGAEAASRLRICPGDRVELQGMPLRVAGLVEGGGAACRTDVSESVFLPVCALCGIMGDRIQEIVLDVPRGKRPQETAEAAQNVLMLRRGVAVEAVTMQVQMEAADSVIAIFVEVLQWVAFVCILVGGVGVMNILLVSVRERRREIGVMKALGASYWQICTLFLLEALLYALSGGMIGTVLGMALIAAASSAIGLQASAVPADCLLVLVMSLAAGLFFGVTPASRAAGMNCADALRE